MPLGVELVDEDDGVLEVDDGELLLDGDEPLPEVELPEVPEVPLPEVPLPLVVSVLELLDGVVLEPEDDPDGL